MYKTAKEKRVRRHLRLRNKIHGTAARPRLSVSITANNMYVQFIDDEAGATLASMSTLSEAFKALNLKRNVEAARALGKLAAEKAKEAAADSSITARSMRSRKPRAKSD